MMPEIWPFRIYVINLLYMISSQRRSPRNSRLINLKNFQMKHFYFESLNIGVYLWKKESSVISLSL